MAYSKDDFLELNLYLEDSEDDEVDLWVTCRDRSMLSFKNVRHNPVRWHGSWSISHEFVGQRATSFLPADEVWHFTTVSKWDNRRNDEVDSAIWDVDAAESVLMNGDDEVEA